MKLATVASVALVSATIPAFGQFNAGGGSGKTNFNSTYSQAQWSSYSLYRERHGRLCDTTDPGALSVVVETSSDATLFEGDGTTSADQGLFEVGVTKDGTRQRALLKFDLPEMPPDAHVECAEIGLHVSRSSITKLPRVGVYRVTTPWTAASHNDVVGGQAKTGDCTWTHSSWPDKKWDSPGGDFDAVELSEETVDADDKHWFGSTRNARDAVQDWISGNVENHGFLLMPVEDNNDGKSTDTGTTAYNVYNGIDSGHDRMPKLVIKYTAPSKGYPVRDATYWRSVTKYSSWSTDRRKQQHKSNFYSFSGGFAACLVMVAIFSFVRNRSAKARKIIDTAATNDIEVPPIN